MSDQPTSPASDPKRLPTTVDYPQSSDGADTRSAEQVESQESVGQNFPPATAEKNVFPAKASGPSPDRESIGRYRVERVLGEGGFGTVYLAHDDELRRPVAVKVPRRARLAREGDIESYLTEARTLAGLDHPGIVPVYDFGRTDDGLCYVVSKYIAGSDLARRLRSGPLAPADAAEVVASAAESLHHAHERGLVHRDIKPANLLLDERGGVHVADFGLAVHADAGQPGADDGARLAGTPPYMSPEQLRGEKHALDARSDLFSLGVVLYELLTAQRPFQGGDAQRLFHQIQHVEPVQPHYVNVKVPAELSRICLRCLAKNPADRYRSAADLAAALRRWQHNPIAQSSSVNAPASPYLPENGQPFGAENARQYLELLQGYRGVDVIPDEVRRLKPRLEEGTLRIGMVTGAIGTGKSSFVRAALPPRLSQRLLVVQGVADAMDTETLLRDALAAAVPAATRGENLPEQLERACAALSDRHLLLVIDQFERWLLAHEPRADTELGRVLQRCDGVRFSCLLVVRNDFRPRCEHFLARLGLALVAQDIIVLELLERSHASRVLALLGDAQQALPAELAALSFNEQVFLDNVVIGISHNKQVCPLRLAQFAQAVRGCLWQASLLRLLGGSPGALAVLLDESFHATGLDAQRGQVARVIIEALLPDGDAAPSPIRTCRQLRQAAGVAVPTQEFSDLLAMLDSELRLIAPVPPSDHATRPGDVDEWSYRLADTHFVPTLRRWLSSKPGAIRLVRSQDRSLTGKQLGLLARLEKKSGRRVPRSEPARPSRGFRPFRWFWYLSAIICSAMVLGFILRQLISAFVDAKYATWPIVTIITAGLLLITVPVYRLIVFWRSRQGPVPEDEEEEEEDVPG